MGYLGNEPTSNFASVTKDLFSGDGSTTAFTLSKASTTNGVAVFVENVRQEPTIAYAVSGTTLTFTAAPVSSSGNNIYVLHHNAPASTATHPAAQDLTAVNGTFTGAVTSTGNARVNGNLGLETGNAPGSNGSGIAVYDADYPRIYLRNSTTGDTAGNGAGIFMNSDDMYISNEDSGGHIIFRTEATEELRILNSGGITFNGDTATANALDEYEEGTWEVDLDNTSESGGDMTAYYTKIGRLVHIMWYSGALTLASSSGTAHIENLPFDVSNVNSMSTFHYIHGNAISNNSTGGYFNAGTNDAYWIQANTTTGATFVDGTNDKYIMMSGSYITDS